MVCVEKTTEELFKRFSSYSTMLRVIARMKRWIPTREAKPKEFITTGELNEVLYVVTRKTQELYLKDLVQELQEGKPIRSKVFIRLCPFLDSHGVVRVGGRLRRSNLSNDMKHPILIPIESHIALLIARHWHIFACHAGPRLMTALINQRLWIIGIRRVVHKVIRECVTCVKFIATNPQPIMADLPAARVQGGQTFSEVGIDYAGPINMKEMNLRKPRIYKVTV